MVTTVEDLTFCCCTVNVPVVAPAGIMSVDGTVAADVLLLVGVTVTPPAGAGPDKVTVAVTTVLELPTTVLGLIVSNVGTGAFTVKTVVNVTPPDEAVIVTGVSTVTGTVEIEKVAVVPPVITVTGVTRLARAGLLLFNVTTSPPDGGMAERVTVPVETRPPGSFAGETEIPARGTVFTSVPEA